ncbi:MAG: hypothetical protein WC521_03355 [Bdellovibrionales bacterium]|jgi:hypothetical protein
MKIVSGENDVFSIQGNDLEGNLRWIFRTEVSPWKGLTCDNPDAGVQEKTNLKAIVCDRIVVGKDGVAEIYRISSDEKVNLSKIRVQESAAEIIQALDDMKAAMDTAGYSKQAPESPKVITLKNPQREISIIRLP